MAQIVLTFPDGVAARIIDAIAATYGYQGTIELPEGSIPNPETKNVFARRMMRQMVFELVKEYEAKQVGIPTMNGARERVKREIVIT